MDIDICFYKCLRKPIDALLEETEPQGDRIAFKENQTNFTFWLDQSVKFPIPREFPETLSLYDVLKIKKLLIRTIIEDTEKVFFRKELSPFNGMLHTSMQLLATEKPFTWQEKSEGCRCMKICR